MLCNICIAISFKPINELNIPLPEDEKGKAKPASRSRMYFAHYSGQKDLLKSAEGGCHFCILLSKSIGRPVPPEVAETQIVLSQWQPDRWSAASGDNRIYVDQNRMGYISVHWSGFSSGPALLNLGTLWMDVAEVFSQSELIGPSSQFHEEMSTGSPSCLDLAGLWINFCHDNRHPCLPRMDQPGEIPSRVIYVDPDVKVGPHLYVSKGERGQYFCLSYCWGDRRKGVTTTQNYERYLKAIPTVDLPKTFQDAIKVTRGLGCKYLWIDAICIIQDSPDDKKKQIPLMGEIYRNATLTIAAGNGTNADSGLFVTRDPRKVRPCRLFQTRPKEEWRPRFPIVVDPQNSRSHTGPLDDRAWILQEEILSTRTLIFGSDCIRWSCVMWSASESEPNGFENTSQGYEFRLRIHSDKWKHGWMEGNNDDTRQIYEDWYTIVERYTSRSLTNVSDRLPALAGLAVTMQTACQGKYLAGLWEEDITSGLLWFVTKSPKVYLPSTSYLAPSWSWASLGHAAIKYYDANYAYRARGPAQVKLISANCEPIPGPGSLFGEISSGHLMLYGTVKAAVAFPQYVDRYRHPYPSPLVSSYGRWTAQVEDETTGTPVGFMALDAPCAVLPADDYTYLSNETKFGSFKIICLLLFADKPETAQTQAQTAAPGWSSSKWKPLGIEMDANGMLVQNKGVEKRYSLCLALVPSGTEKHSYRRVGLVEMYDSFWEKGSELQVLRID